MMAHYMYSHIPAPEGNTVGEVIFRRPVYNGKAIAETVLIICGRDIHFNAEIVRPVKDGRVPVFTWNQYKDILGCPIEDLVLQHGYAIMEFQKEQLAEDNGKGLRGKLATAYVEYDWGILAMWAWGHMRCADYLLTTDWADPDKLIATGHSRGGKAAMCAAIYDERFALCASSGSGCGGAGCFRFLGSRYGLNTGLCEVAGSIEDAFPFWWTDNFGQFGNRTHTYTRSYCGDFDPMAMMGNSMSTLIAPDKIGKLGDEEYMPFDLHFLKALIAPRALITTDGMGDTWANPMAPRSPGGQRRKSLTFWEPLIKTPSISVTAAMPTTPSTGKPFWTSAMPYFGASPLASISTTLTRAMPPTPWPGTENRWTGNLCSYTTAGAIPWPPRIDCLALQYPRWETRCLCAPSGAFYVVTHPLSWYQ